MKFRSNCCDEESKKFVKSKSDVYKTMLPHPMKKCSSWPAMTYPGLDQVTQGVKR